MSAAYSSSTTTTDDFAPAREVFDQMVHRLESPAGLGMTHSELEEYVIGEGREVQRRMMQGHLQLRVRAEGAVAVVDGSGVVLDKPGRRDADWCRSWAKSRCLGYCTKRRAHGDFRRWMPG